MYYTYIIFIICIENYDSYSYLTFFENLFFILSIFIILYTFVPIECDREKKRLCMEWKSRIASLERTTIPPHRTEN